jgi:hypothetical protein
VELLKAQAETGDIVLLLEDESKLGIAWHVAGGTR